MTIEQFLNNVIGSSWLLPLLAILGWILVKYLDGKFLSTDDFNKYKEARGEEEREYREHIKDEFEEKQRYIETVDKKANDNGREVARLEGKLES